MIHIFQFIGRPFVILLIFLLLDTQILQSQSSEFAKNRRDMVNEQIENRGINHNATIQAMLRVPRHRFVPEDKKNLAYGDHPLPIGYGQTISQPYIVAYMTEVINPKSGQKVLEIGTGSGYQAAVLSEIVDSVFTIEIVEGLYKESTGKFQQMRYTNIKTKHADGYFGWKEKAPFDAIVVTAAAEFIPPQLIEQLKPGGKMIIPVGSPFLIQELILVEKTDSGIKTNKLMSVKFVPFVRASKD